jgi:prepilin-type N-terminal cleavage/methylation domain-containing protein
MSLKKIDETGFTLIELLLAMTLFSLMMIIATAGFLGMNRAYTKGVVRKQISEAAQSASEDITRTLRTDGRALSQFNECSNTAPQKNGCPSLGGSWRGAICFASVRYIWGGTALYKQTGEVSGCASSTNSYEANGLKVIDSRYRVEQLQITPLEQANLFEISGVIRTTDDSTFNNLLDTDKTKITCKGSAFLGSTGVCAVEKFKFIINARGDGV